MASKQGAAASTNLKAHSGAGPTSLSAGTPARRRGFKEERVLRDADDRIKPNNVNDESKMSAAQRSHDHDGPETKEEGGTDDEVRAMGAIEDDKAFDEAAAEAALAVLTDDQRCYLQKAFQEADQNGSGQLATTELLELIGKLDLGAGSVQHAENTLSELELAKTGVVSYREYLIVMAMLFKQSLTADELSEAFQVFDSDNSGYIDVSELKRVMAVLGDEKFTDAECEELFQMADTSGDGQVSWEEFSVVMRTLLE